MIEKIHEGVGLNGHAANKASAIDALIKESVISPDEVQRELAEKAAAKALITEGPHDEGNANCVHLRYQGRFLHSSTLGWLHHTGTHWSMNEAEAAVERACTETLLARIQATLAETRSDPDIVKKCVPNSGKVQGAKAQLRSLVSISDRAFDVEPDYLNCKNGVVDLRTGQIVKHNTAQRFMHCAAVDYVPGADWTIWANWLKDAVGEEAADWLQTAVGYSITGHTREEILFYLYGPPRSGKGTFTETLLTLLETPLAKEVSFSMFLAQRTGDSQNFDLAPLKPCRFIAASESNTYERFNEAKIKALTGGNEVYCAFKHRDHFNYRPQFKIWLSSNQPVNADPDDDAVWGRLRLIEFLHSHLGEEDKNLKVKMRSDEVLRGVLAWAIQGAMKWYKLGGAGLAEIEGSAKVKASHRAELDNVQAWLDEMCEPTDGFSAYAPLYTSYEEWCKERGVEPKKQKGFSQSLINKSYAPKLSKTEGKMVRGYVGLRLR